MNIEICKCGHKKEDHGRRTTNYEGVCLVRSEDKCEYVDMCYKYVQDNLRFLASLI